MKKIFLAVTCFFIASALIHAQVKFDALTLTPQFPKTGQTVNFKYNKNLSSLIDAKKIDIVVYLLEGSEYKVVEKKFYRQAQTFQEVLH